MMVAAMYVLNVMTWHPTWIASDATLARALDEMFRLGCHHLPVLSHDRHLVGVLSFSDCERALGKALKSGSTWVNSHTAHTVNVSAVMTTAPIIIEPNAPAAEAARLMLEHVIGCLPVMRGETLVGIVTRSDLLMALIMLTRKTDYSAAQDNGI